MPRSVKGLVKAKDVVAEPRLMLEFAIGKTFGDLYRERLDLIVSSRER